MTDAATPEPASRKRSLIVAGVVLVVVAAVIGSSFLYASSAAGDRAADYDDDFAAWVKKDQPVLLSAAAELPGNVFPVKGNVYSAKSRAQQKQGCEAVARSREKVTAAAGRLPKVDGGGVLGAISSDLGKAGDRSAAREKAIEAYAKDAEATLAQIERDCRFALAINTQGSRYSKVFARAEKYLMKRGDVEPRASCTEYDTCVSSITSKKNKYADVRLKATQIYRDGPLKLWTSKQCRATSYGAVCAAIGKAYTASIDQQQKNYEYVRSTRTSVDNDGIPAGNRKLDKIVASGQKRIKKDLLARHPDVSKNKEVRKYPSWAGKFFRESAVLALRELTEQNESIAGL